VVKCIDSSYFLIAMLGSSRSIQIVVGRVRAVLLTFVVTKSHCLWFFPFEVCF